MLNMRIEHVLAISVAAAENQLVERETKLTIPDGVYDGVNTRACVLEPLDHRYGDVIAAGFRAAVLRHDVQDEKRPPAENKRTNHNRKSSRQFDLNQYGPSPFGAVADYAVNVSVSKQDYQQW